MTTIKGGDDGLKDVPMMVADGEVRTWVDADGVTRSCHVQVMTLPAPIEVKAGETMSITYTGNPATGKISAARVSIGD